VTTVGERWLHALQRLADRAAHEIRNPLNGAVVSLEVVRHRAATPAAALEAIVPFAVTAAGEVEKAVELVGALLALARPASTPVDLWAVLRALVVLYHAIAASDGGSVTVVRPTDVSVETATNGDAARLALASALEATLASRAAVHCSVERVGGNLAVRVRGAGDISTIPEPVQDTIVSAGIQLRDDSDGITLLFSALGRDGMEAT
jgi:signal transduction histidine kinase